MPLGEGVLLERGHQRGVFPSKRRYFDAVGSSSVKTVADRNMLLIITSTGHELFSFVNTDDFERPWTPKIRDFPDFFMISGCDTHFKSELHQNA